MWHRRKWAGLLLRLAGALLLAIACAADARLFGASPRRAVLLDYPLALAAFVAASAGGAMLALGAHLFDPVPVAGRWQRRF
jgi:hypothetical protein